MESIDNRVVQMGFNNKQFESGARTSIETLKNLKEGLKLEESAKSLSNLEKVGNSFSLAGIAAGVENLNNKFSTLGIIGITTLQNIATSAIEAGKRLISSLTVDPIKTGLEEYETKMNAITTIMTNTASKGTTLDQVNAALEELNTYADKTIYNFAEMTRNIGTFTAAGVDLKTSATSIKGIANLAAGSGSNAQQASTAMYQLSQAIAAGSVKLMDWNSVVNAGMGGELFQKALEKTAVELGHGRDMSVSFRESLEKGWITTEVLTKTLAKFAEDESLLKAATQVKTLTQMIDTMKESVQSGWAKTWETIIGNREEAAKFFTSINDGFGSIIGSSADARNSMLQFWKDNGGRDAIIQALTNAFTGLQSVLQPINEAFRNIFPAVTGKQLVEWSINLRMLTAHLTVSSQTANDLKRTFKGLFAILDIGKQAFLALGNSVNKFINYVSPATSGVLSFTAMLGDYAVALDNAIKSSNAFNVAVDKISSFMKPIADGIRKSITIIIEVFKEFANVDLTGLDTFSERVQARFEPFTKLGNFVQGVFVKMAEAIKKIAPVFYSLATVIGRAFDNMQQNIVKALDNAEFNSVFDIINGGLLAGILLGLTKFVGSMANISKNAGGFLKSLVGILDGVKGCLQAYQSQLKANTLLKIAGAMGILAASLVALSLIDSNKLTASLTAMSIMFTELFGSMAIFEKIMGSAGFKSIGKITRAMIALSTAILILSVAMTKLAKLDWNGIAKGLTSVAVLSATLVVSSKLLENSSSGLTKSALGFILFATAINILVEAVQKLSTIDVAGLAKGLISVGVLATELSLFMKATDLSGMGVTKGLGFMALAASIVILAEAVKVFSNIDTGSLIKGLLGVAAVLGEVAAFTKLTGNSKNVISTAIGLTILGSAMLIFGQAIQNMGNMSMEQIGKGLLTMAGALAEIAVAMRFMPKDMVLTGTGLVIVASSLVILSNALSNMGGMSWEQIAKGLVTLAGSLTIIATAMSFMTLALPGAAALLVVSGALAILAPVLEKLGSMSLSEIGKGLLALAGMFTVIGVAGLVLAPLIPTILGLSAAIALLGIGCAAVGAGMLAFSAGLTALSVAGAAGTAALVATITALVGLIPFTLTTLAKGLLDFVKVIGDGGPVITEALTSIVLAVIKAINAITPNLIDCLYKLLLTLLETIAKYTPKLTQAGMDIIIALLTGISDNIGKVVNVVTDIITNFLNALGDNLPKIVDAGYNMIIDFINGLADSVRNNTPVMIKAIWNLVSAIMFSLLDVVPESVEAGENLVNGLVEGMKNNLKMAVDWAGQLGQSVIDSAKKVLGIHSPSKVFREEVGVMIGKGLANGIKDSTKDAKNASSEMGKGVYEAAKDWIDERKYYNKLSLEEELYVWEEVQKQYEQGSTNSINADKEIYRVKKEIRQEEYNDSIKWIDERKYYNELSLQEELAAWERVQKRYEEGSEERIKADKEVYRVKNELTKADYQNSVDWIDGRKYYNELSLQEELEAWERVQKRYAEGTDERIKADKEVYRVKNELTKADYQNSIDWIDERKYYNELSLGQELAAWQRVQKRYDEGTEERKKADREVYRVKKEITEKMKSLEDDYYEKTKSVNEKLKADIEKLNTEYDNAVKSRADSLYNAYGLFDKVGEEEAVSGDELFSNLQDQLVAFTNWRENIKSLASKGVGDDFIKELESMGPKSAVQIKALNSLSSDKLDDYVTLWKAKHNLAKTQAVGELEDLRVETQVKIGEITTQSQTELDKLRTTWYSEMDKINYSTTAQLATLNQTWNQNTTEIKTQGISNFMELASSIASIDWVGVGIKIVKGITDGANTQTSALANTIMSATSKAIEAAKELLGDNSALSPTITPVLDLSNIKTGGSEILSFLSGNPVISTISKGISLAGMVANNIAQQAQSTGETTVEKSEPTQINNTYNVTANVREESDIKKVARQIYNLQVTGDRG